MSMFRTYTETYDLNTEADCPTLLGIHTPIGTNPYKFLYPAFMMYRKYKYVGCDVTIVNASHLPISPDAFAITGGTSNVDPRDMLNPILFKGAHGDSLGDIIDSMYGGLTSDIFKSSSLDKEKFRSALTNFYYTAIGDDAWRKSGIQSTLRIKGLHPLVYQLATQMQIAPSNSVDPSAYWENSGVVTGSSSDMIGRPINSLGNPVRSFAVTAGKFYDPVSGSYTTGIPQTMFTSRTQKLGWLDTQQISGNNDTSIPFSTGKIALLPKIMMGVLLLPPANKCYTYLRVIIRHKFAFREYRTVTTGAADPTYDYESDSIGYYDAYTGGVSTDTSATTASLMSAYEAMEDEADESE